jgi:hypothetical protein
MALTLNGRLVFFNNPGTYQGIQSLQSGNFIKGGLRNRNAGGFNNRFSAYPNGALHPQAFILPQKAGSISSYTRSRAALAKDNANLIPAMPMIASSSAALSVLNAQLDQVVQFIANGVLNLTGSATLAAAVSAQASSTMTLAANALAGGIFPITADSTMSLSPSVTLTAQAFMEAAAGGPTPLSPEGLASAVLGSLLADYTDPGTVGEALNNVGASSNPWSADLASNNAANTFGERVQKLLTKAQFLSLKD